jgi:hypothetical protein
MDKNQKEQKDQSNQSNQNNQINQQKQIDSVPTHLRGALTIPRAEAIEEGELLLEFISEYHCGKMALVPWTDNANHSGAYDHNCKVCSIANRVKKRKLARLRKEESPCQPK